MNKVSEEEIKAIVHRVVQATLGDRQPQQQAALPVIKEKLGDSGNIKPKEKLVAIGADHGGFDLKEALKTFLSDEGYEVIDCGTTDKRSVDYPDFTLKVAQMVSEGKAWRGIMVDGAGIGSSMAANKVRGVRAALCYDYATAVNSREHNDANMLTLGGGLVGVNLAKQIVSTWLSTPFGGGRHAQRVDKIMDIEKKYFKMGS